MKRWMTTMPVPGMTRDLVRIGAPDQVRGAMHTAERTIQ